MLDPDLIFATPELVDQDFSESSENALKLIERCQITAQFLKGKVSPTDFMDYIQETVCPDTTAFLDAVEANFNRVVDLHGRPII